MSSEWKEYSIDQLKKDDNGSIAIGPFGSRMKSDCYVESGIPVIRGTNISGSRDFDGEFVFITKEKADQLGSSNVFKGDLVFPHRGSIGEVGIVLDDRRYVISSSLMKLTCNESIVNPLYLFYFFKTKQGKHELLKNASQVGTPGIGQPLSSLKSIRLQLPELSFQNKIVDILDAIDKKLAKNNQINQTLEAIAQTLFKSWFVDFDPVKAKIAAKEQGKDPQLAAMMTISGKSEDEINQMHADKRKQLAETADLFPEEMVERELGWIPKGWTVKPIDEIANFLNGLALQKYPVKINDPFLPVIKIVQLKKGEAKGAEMASKNIPKEYIIDNGDVVFSWSGSLFADVWCGGKGALNQHLFKVTSTNYPKWFYYQWIIFHLPEFIRIAADKAVTMGHIKREHLSQAICIVPDELIINKADILFSHLLDKYIITKIESLKLSEARDILLPKLLSGELNL